jgi:hypothetical protein
LRISTGGITALECSNQQVGAEFSPRSLLTQFLLNSLKKYAVFLRKFEREIGSSQVNNGRFRD